MADDNKTIVQNQLKDRPCQLKLSLMFQSNKCNLENFSKFVWVFDSQKQEGAKAERIENVAASVRSRPGHLVCIGLYFRGAMCDYHTATIFQEQIYL